MQPSAMVQPPKEEAANDVAGTSVRPETVAGVSSSEETVSDVAGPSRPRNVAGNVAGDSSSEATESDEDIQSREVRRKQLVPLDLPVNGGAPIAAPAVPVSGRPRTPRQPLTVDTFTVQCYNCLKWRLIPEEKRYEEIREHHGDRPFSCATAAEWRPGLSCDDPSDIEQDGTGIWAIDVPNVAKPPEGWKRLLRVRKKGGTKFADVYYKKSGGVVFRSLREVQEFLEKHPEQRVTIGQFSFQSPKPLDEGYVHKRKRPRLPAFHGPMAPGRSPGPEDEDEDDVQNAEPLAWAPPAEDAEEPDDVNRGAKRGKGAPGGGPMAAE